MNRTARAVLVAIALAAIALFAVRGDLRGPAEWTPDGLFYQARALELDGADRASSLAQTFQGPLGAELRREDPAHSGDPAWSAYHAQFYERRVAVPYAATLLDGVAGDRALLDISLAGYVAAILAIFGLLLLFFRLPIAAAVTLLTIFLPALTEHSGFPQTDSWGLALEAAALAFGVLALRRGPRWVVPWALTILVLSFTRDNAWIPIAGAALLAVRSRSRVSVSLLLTSVAAAIPVLILFSAPTRELLATMLNDTRPTPDGSWGFILERYPGAVVDMLHADGGFVLDGAWYSCLYLLGGLGLLFALGRGDAAGAAAAFLKAAAVAGAAFVLLVPVFSAFRLELALVPMAAFGFALAADQLAQRLAVPLGTARPALRWSRTPP